MDSISIAQNIILRYRQAQEQEWAPEVSLPLRGRVEDSSLYPPPQLLPIAGRKRKLKPPEEAIYSDCTDEESAIVTAARIHIRQPSTPSNASSSPQPSSSSAIEQDLESTPPRDSPSDPEPEPDPATTSTPIPTTMAVPPEITTANLTGTYLLNRTLSDSSQTTLKMQGVNFVIRSAVAYSNVTVTLTQYTDAEGRKHLDQEQISTGGIKNFEDRIMDGEFTEKHNWIWGKVNGKSRYVKIEDIEDGYLREGWSKDCVEGELVEGYVESVTDKWTAMQIWGFAEVEGQRRHVRKILASKPGWKDQRIRMVYDWSASA